MKKGRFIFLVTATILMAPPLGGIFIWLLFCIASLFIKIGGDIVSWEVLLVFMAFSYLLGFIPTLITGVVAAGILFKGKALSIHKIYGLSFFLTLLNVLFAILQGEPDIHEIVGLSIATILSMTVVFFAAYQLMKKLLPWAGTSLIEPTKAGTP